MRPRTLEGTAVPGPIRDVAQRLCDAGHGVWWIGEGLLALLRGEPPVAWVLATNAAPDDVPRVLEHAIPSRRGGAAFVVPSAAGPVDVQPLRWGSQVEGDLAHAGFRLLAMAWSWPAAQLVDPYGGIEDFVADRLAAVGDAAAALAERPLLALVAARLIAEQPLSLDPALAIALREARTEPLARVSAAALRREISALLLAPGAGRGVALLRESGTERALGLRSDAGTARLVDAMPCDLALRLLAWTAGHGGNRLLGRLRFAPECRQRVGQLLQYHPVEQRLSGARRPALRRALRRLPDGAFAALAGLRAAQLANAGSEEYAEDARRALAALHEAVRALELEADRAAHEPVLVWRGRDVILALGIDPGPQVGEALRYLREQVAQDDKLNTPEALRGLLDTWRLSRASGADASP